MSDVDIEHKFWKAVKADRTVMVGTAKVPPRPMTLLLDPDVAKTGWIFTSRQNELLVGMKAKIDAQAAFASKGHDVFASILGTLSIHNDRAEIDRLWNPFVAAWFKDGKDDADLVLLRFDMDSAEIWSDASSAIAGLKIILGVDPKADYSKKVTKVEF